MEMRESVCVRREEETSLMTNVSLFAYGTYKWEFCLNVVNSIVLLILRVGRVLSLSKNIGFYLSKFQKLIFNDVEPGNSIIFQNIYLSIEFQFANILLLREVWTWFPPYRFPCSYLISHIWYLLIIIKANRSKGNPLEDKAINGKCASNRFQHLEHIVCCVVL